MCMETWTSRTRKSSRSKRRSAPISGRCSMCSRSRVTRMIGPRLTLTKRSAGRTRPSPFAATWPSWERSRGASIRICASGARGRFRHSTSRCARSEGTLLAEHNLHACFGAIREVRQAIAEGDLWGLAERRARAHPALLDAVRELRRQNEFLEEFEPVSRPGALTYVGAETAHRPILHRFRRRLQERYSAPPAKGLLVFPEGGRPFGERLAAVVDQVARVADVHFVVKSVWGPVPLELDQVWPMCQTIVPEAIDLEALEAAEVFFRDWAAG